MMMILDATHTPLTISRAHIVSHNSPLAFYHIQQQLHSITLCLVLGWNRSISLIEDLPSILRTSSTWRRRTVALSRRSSTPPGWTSGRTASAGVASWPPPGCPWVRWRCVAAGRGCTSRSSRASWSWRCRTGTWPGRRVRVCGKGRWRSGWDCYISWQMKSHKTQRLSRKFCPE